MELAEIDAPEMDTRVERRLAPGGRSAPFPVATGLERAAFNLGWDFALYKGLVPPPEAANEVKRGFLEGLKRFEQHQKHADRFVRKWLQLRLHALRRGRQFCEDVTPQYLEAIDVPYCPVTFERLTHAEHTSSDWSVDRLHNDGGYAIGNIAVMSTRANEAKGSLSATEIVLMALRGRSERSAMPAGLSWKEWMRLAALVVGPYAAATDDFLAMPQCTVLAPRVPAMYAQILQYELVARLNGDPVSEAMVRRAHKLGNAQCRKRFRKIERKVEERAPCLPRAKWHVASPFDCWLEEALFKEFCAWIASCPLEALDELLGGKGKRSVRRVREVVSTWAVDRRGYAT